MGVRDAKKKNTRKIFLDLLSVRDAWKAIQTLANNYSFFGLFAGKQWMIPVFSLEDIKQNINIYLQTALIFKKVGPSFQQWITDEIQCLGRGT